jgi:hypothetical protein
MSKKWRTDQNVLPTRWLSRSLCSVYTKCSIVGSLCQGNTTTSSVAIEHISYEWEEIHAIRSYSVAIRIGWDAHKNGKPFQCYGMSYRVRAVSQYRKFPIHTKPSLIAQYLSISDLNKSFIEEASDYPWTPRMACAKIEFWQKNTFKVFFFCT